MTYKLIDYERLKAFSEGLKSKYALKKDMIEPQERKYLQLKTEGLELTRILEIEVYFEHLVFNICTNPKLNNSSFFNYIEEWCREYDYNYDLVLSSERYKKNGFCGEWQKQAIDAPSMCIKSHEGKQLTPEEVTIMCQNTNDDPLVWFDSELLAELKSTYTLRRTMVASYFKFVQKAKGKRLSSNDYTNVDKAKVDAIPDNPKYTDTTYDLSKYATKQEVPTKLSQLTNDENFKTESEIQAMIEKASSLKKEVVTSLPTTGKDDVIYLVKDDKGKENNNYLEYLWLNGKYELIGSTQVDLSGYAKKSDIKTKLSEMTEDSTHRTVTDDEKAKWNKQFGSLTGFTVKKVNKTNIPWVIKKESEWTTTLDGYNELAINDCELSEEISKKLDKTELVEFTDQEIEEAFK